MTPDMPELPIYPDAGREAPGYVLLRRLKRLQKDHGAVLAPASRELRRRCARETLLLTGHGPARENAAAPSDPLVERLLSALELLEREAEAKREPDRSLVQAIHRLAFPGADGAFRISERPPQFASARHSSPRFIEAKLDNLFGWLAAESGRSMFPAERMTLFFARFLEIAPFDRGNFRTAHLSVSLFAHAEGYPPVSLRFEEADGIRADVERAIAFQTEPLVDRFSDAIARSLDVWEELSGAVSTKR